MKIISFSPKTAACPYSPIPIDLAYITLQPWVDWLKTQPGVEKVEITGALRRHCLSLAELDLAVAVDDPSEIQKKLVDHPEVRRVIENQPDRLVIDIYPGIPLRIWFQPANQFGTLLAYTTGSLRHLQDLDHLAQHKGFLFSRWGLTHGGTVVEIAEEARLYETVGLPHIPPELREGNGEIKAALNGGLPDLVDASDLKSDLHIHTDWSDGRDSIQTIVETAVRRGLKIAAITDHSTNHMLAGAVLVERIRDQGVQIRRIEAALEGKLRILRGIEADILPDGTIDTPDEVLAELDLVVASLHTTINQPQEVVTARLIRAIQNPHVDIIAHPSGHLRPYPGADLDWTAVYQAAREHHVALEINSSPEHLDMDDIHAREAVHAGVLIAINTDSHRASQLDRIHFGLGIARRAWAARQQIINTWEPEQLLSWLNTRSTGAVS